MKAKKLLNSEARIWYKSMLELCQYTWKTKPWQKVVGKWDTYVLSLNISNTYLFHILQKSLVIGLDNIQKSSLHLFWCCYAFQGI